jgi:transketolase N-terminal domain/subunit
MTSTPTEPTMDRAAGLTDPGLGTQQPPPGRTSGGSWASGPSSTGSSAIGTVGPEVTSGDPAPLAALESVQRRVLWLSTAIVDAANRLRPNPSGIKVGGHQASSASMVSIMTALWFADLTARDRVSVKPHASPVLHAINYLLGDLDRSYLTKLRARGGLQSYPSRTKDPDRVDFSTGSVGLGAAAPLFAAVTRRYVDAHFGERPRSRFVALIGDAELDEGNIWEAVADPVTQGLGNVLWVVDFNRQSLDRVVPGVRIAQWSQQFEAAGWHVATVKYGRRLRAASSCRAATRCAAGSTTCPTSTTRRPSGWSRPRCARPSSTVHPSRSWTCARGGTTAPCPTPSSTWAGTTCRACSRCSASATRSPTGRAWCSPTR